jgi:hypothetical protein
MVGSRGTMSAGHGMLDLVETMLKQHDWRGGWRTEAVSADTALWAASGSIRPA